MRGLVFCALPLSSTDLFSSVNCILCVYFVAPLYIYIYITKAQQSTHKVYN